MSVALVIHSHAQTWLTRTKQFFFTSIQTADQNGMMGTMMQDLAFAIPGVDEAMSFAEIMKYVTTTLCAPFAFAPSHRRK